MGYCIVREMIYGSVINFIFFLKLELEGCINFGKLCFFKKVKNKISFKERICGGVFSWVFLRKYLYILIDL